MGVSKLEKVGELNFKHILILSLFSLWRENNAFWFKLPYLLILIHDMIPNSQISPLCFCAVLFLDAGSIYI